MAAVAGAAGRGSCEAASVAVEVVSAVGVGTGAAGSGCMTGLKVAEVLWTG